MNKKVCVLLMGIFLSGCFSAAGCLRDKEAIVKAYTPATNQTKNELYKDLRSGKITLGATLDYIRQTYGDSDEIFVTEYAARVIYTLENGKKITLWFDNCRRLSMWRV